jgi:hypothetical protein
MSAIPAGSVSPVLVAVADASAVETILDEIADASVK